MSNSYFEGQPFSILKLPVLKQSAAADAGPTDAQTAEIYNKQWM